MLVGSMCLLHQLYSIPCCDDAHDHDHVAPLLVRDDQPCIAQASQLLMEYAHNTGTARAPNDDIHTLRHTPCSPCWTQSTTTNSRPYSTATANTRTHTYY